MIIFSAAAVLDNVPCSVLESLKSLHCGSLHVSITLPVPSVLNIRLTAQQQNVLELTNWFLTQPGHRLLLSIWAICLLPSQWSENKWAHASYTLCPFPKTPLPSYQLLFSFPFFMFSLVSFSFNSLLLSPLSPSYFLRLLPSLSLVCPGNISTNTEPFWCLNVHYREILSSDVFTILC